MKYYIVMAQTSEDIVEKVFDKLTEMGFSWADGSSPRVRMHTFLFYFDYFENEWKIKKEQRLVINLNDKELTWGSGTFFWCENDYRTYLTDVETLEYLKQKLFILNGGDV